MTEKGIRGTYAYQIILDEMRSWDGTLELRGQDGDDMFGRPRKWIMCAYEHWAESIASRIIDANEGDRGKADWMYDDYFDIHIPCCSQPKGTWRCGNGPLQGDAILTGDCGEDHDD